VEVSSRNRPTTTTPAMSIRIVDRDGVQTPLRFPGVGRPAVDALATFVPFMVAGRRFLY
jgi:hypothetical protein